MVVKEATRAFLVKYCSYFSNSFRGQLLSNSLSTIFNLITWGGYIIRSFSFAHIPLKDRIVSC